MIAKLPEISTLRGRLAELEKSLLRVKTPNRRKVIEQDILRIRNRIIALGGQVYGVEH